MYELDDFLNKDFVYVIVGASNNPKKYGYKILQTLLESGFKVIPVNPKEDIVQGLQCYKRLAEIKENIDVVNFVVPPYITLKVLEEVIQLKIDKVWFQPGSFNNEVLEFVKVNHIKYLKDFCLLKSALK